MMQSLMLGLGNLSHDNELNRDALKKILAALQRQSGKVVEAPSYTITSFDVERDDRIGAGGFSGESESCLA